MDKKTETREYFSDFDIALIHLAQDLPIDFLEKMQKLIDAGADVNAKGFYDCGPTYVLAAIIKEVYVDYQNRPSIPDDFLYQIVRLFIKNGFDASKDNGAQGALCLVNMAWAFGAWNHHLVDVATLLIDAGTNPDKKVFPYSDNSYETPFSAIGLRCTLETNDGNSYSCSIYEPIYQILKAKIEGRDYRKIRSHIHGHGQSISRVLLVGPNEDDVARIENNLGDIIYKIKAATCCGIVFECGDHPIFINHYGMVYEDANPLDCPESCTIDVTSDFAPWIGKCIKEIRNENGKSCLRDSRFEFADGDLLYVIRCDKPKDNESIATYCLFRGDKSIALTVQRHLEQALADMPQADKEDFLARFYDFDVQGDLYKIDIASEREAMILLCQCNSMLKIYKVDSTDNKVFSVLLAILEEIHLGKGGRLPTEDEIRFVHKNGQVMAMNYFANQLRAEHQD